MHFVIALIRGLYYLLLLILSLNPKKIEIAQF